MPEKESKEDPEIVRESEDEDMSKARLREIDVEIDRLERIAKNEREVQATLRKISSARLQEIVVHADIPIAVRDEAIETLEDFLDELLNGGMVDSYTTKYDPGLVVETPVGNLRTQIGSANATKEAVEAEWEAEGK